MSRFTQHVGYIIDIYALYSCWSTFTPWACLVSHYLLTKSCLQFKEKSPIKAREYPTVLTSSRCFDEMMDFVSEVPTLLINHLGVKRPWYFPLLSTFLKPRTPYQWIMPCRNRRTGDSPNYDPKTQETELNRQHSNEPISSEWIIKKCCRIVSRFPISRNSIQWY